MIASEIKEREKHTADEINIGSKKYTEKSEVPGICHEQMHVKININFVFTLFAVVDCGGGGGD